MSGRVVLEGHCEQGNDIEVLKRGLGDGGRQQDLSQEELLDELALECELLLSNVAKALIGDPFVQARCERSRFQFFCCNEKGQPMLERSVVVLSIGFKLGECSPSSRAPEEPGCQSFLPVRHGDVLLRSCK